MHLAEGVISSPVVLGSGLLVGCAGVAIGLRQLDETQAMRTAVLSSSFFVASLIHIPVFGVSIHLTLTGLLGIVLGWAAFPAVFVALILQAVLFGFGGLTTLGLNTCIMAVPAVAAHYGLRALRVGPKSASLALVSGGLGAVAILLASLVMAGILATAGDAFTVVAVSVLAAHIPILVLEGLVTSAVVGFLQKVSPELLAGPVPQAACSTGESDT